MTNEPPTVPPPGYQDDPDSEDEQLTIKQDTWTTPPGVGEDEQRTLYEPPPTTRGGGAEATLIDMSPPLPLPGQEPQADGFGLTVNPTTGASRRSEDVTLVDSRAPSDPPSTSSSKGNLPSSALKGGSSASNLKSSTIKSGSKLREGEVYAGKYELVNEIARGGMGVVYKARQIDLNRVVALKVMLSGGYASEEERRRFILEAEASAQLKHPHIVPVYDIGEVEGNLYFTMDYVEGAPLSKRKKDLDRKQLLDIMIQAADGMGYAHQRGIIHRDLKPANIMLDANDRALIMDFGLAKQVEVVDSDGQPSLLTREGAVMGTPHYMPPEQADGRISEIDVRTDVYALGGILYELWTGKLPFLAKSITELMFQIYEQDPVPPRDVDPSIDWDMEAIILKAMEKSKDRRYQTAAELRQDLENVRDGLPVSAQKATLVYRTKKWVRRKRGPLAVAAAFVVLLSVGLFAYQRKASEAARQAYAKYRAGQVLRNHPQQLRGRGPGRRRAPVQGRGAPG
jgi:tRNA A-37 threonylcarbamoyl transferase component Bud32